MVFTNILQSVCGLQHESMLSNLKLAGSKIGRHNGQGVRSLTFGLGDGAANGGAGGGDGTHRRAHAIWGVHPSHGSCVGNPRCWVDRPDWLTCPVKLEHRLRNSKVMLSMQEFQLGKRKRLKLTPGKSKAAPGVWIPALSHSQRNWPGVKDRIMEFYLSAKKIVFLLNMQLTLACARCL